jgi:hypothetical protein
MRVFVTVRPGRSGASLEPRFIAPELTLAEFLRARVR